MKLKIEVQFQYITVDILKLLKTVVLSKPLEIIFAAKGTGSPSPLCHGLE